MKQTLEELSTDRLYKSFHKVADWAYKLKDDPVALYMPEHVISELAQQLRGAAYTIENLLTISCKPDYEKMSVKELMLLVYELLKIIKNKLKT